MWKAKYDLLIMLLKYEQCDLITEVIIIDNCHKDNIDTSFFSKVRILQQEENIYVNPAWNLGVQEAKTELVVLANDDIVIDDFESYMKFVLLNLKRGMVFGFDINCFPNKRLNGLKEKEIKPISKIQHGYGVFLIFYKDDHKPIPPIFKVWYGDWWIHYWLDAYSIDGVNVETVMRTTSRTLPHYKKCLGGERKAYKLFLKKEEV